MRESMAVSDQEGRVYSVLDSLGIEYSRYTHPPVFTIEEAKSHWGDFPGTHCKNLFLRNKKGTCHYLVILEQSKVADMKSLTKRLQEARLSFASPERLMRFK